MVTPLLLLCFLCGAAGAALPFSYSLDQSVPCPVGSGQDSLLVAEDGGNDARIELHTMLREDKLRGMPLLVFANKQDLPGALSAAEVTERLGLEELRDRQWHVQPCCATTGDGLQEGLNWLATGVRAGSAVAVPAAEEVLAEEAPAAGKAGGIGGGGCGGGGGVAAADVAVAVAVGVGGAGAVAVAADGQGSSSSSSTDDDNDDDATPSPGAPGAPAATARQRQPCRWANRPGEWSLALASGFGGASGAARVAELLAAGADPNEAQNGTVALVCAAVNGHLGVVEQLLACAGIDVNAVGVGGRADGKTALLLAGIMGSAELAKLLLAHGETDTGVKFHGKTALDWAREGGHGAVVALLEA